MEERQSRYARRHFHEARRAHPHHREHKLASCRTHAGKVGGKEALAEKCGIDAVRVVACAYDTYTNPSKNNGVLLATLTLFPASAGLLFPQANLHRVVSRPVRRSSSSVSPPCALQSLRPWCGARVGPPKVSAPCARNSGAI
jgi:hypothetical protein